MGFSLLRKILFIDIVQAYRRKRVDPRAHAEKVDFEYYKIYSINILLKIILFGGSSLPILNMEEV